jgi:hypothetical protein
MSICPIQQGQDGAVADEKGPVVEQREVLSVGEEKKLLRRIDLWCGRNISSLTKAVLIINRICPMMALSMALQFLDKQALPAASILGIIQDLVPCYLQTQRCETDSTCSESFRNPILLGGLDLFLRLPYPDRSGGVSHRASTYRQVPCRHIVRYSSDADPTFSDTYGSFAWAIATGCTAAVHSFGGLMATRFVLGAAEAAAIPCFSIMTGMFYKREEHPLRHGYWFLGTSLGMDPLCHTS